ncbi:hypothetical protein VIC_003705 [Vibrio coralliilyticus ATCC BAA-450]|nr:hypothetical protein VIC_003705 [Vibrio coralliilyticus ATCC BAA-450]
MPMEFSELSSCTSSSLASISKLAASALTVSGEAVPSFSTL